MTVSIAVTNLKRGSGKTTTAVNLAVNFARLGRWVLFVDLAWPAHGSRALGLSSLTSAKLSVALIRPKVHFAEGVQPSTIPGLDAIASDAGLPRVERELEGPLIPFYSALSWGLEGFQHDYVIIDCPRAPYLNLTRMALLASTHRILPTDGAPYGREPLERTARETWIREGWKGDRTKFLFTRFRFYTKPINELAAQRRAFQTTIPWEPLGERTPREGVLPLSRWNLAAEAYEALAREVMEIWPSREPEPAARRR